MDFLDNLYNEKQKRIREIGSIPIMSPFKFPRPYTFEDHERIEVMLSSLDLLEPHERMIALHSIVQEIERLGDGKYGDVYHSKCGPFILKVIRRKTKVDLDAFMQEYLNGLGINYLVKDIPNFSYVYTMFTCSLPNETGWCTRRERYPYLVMENVDKSIELHSYSREASLENLVPICFEIAMAMAMAWDKAKYVHNDFHWKNVLIQDREVNTKYTINGEEFNYTNTKTVRIIDYGLSVFMDYTPEYIEDYYYHFPEMINPKQTRDIGVFLNEALASSVGRPCYPFFRDLHYELTKVDVSWHRDWKRVSDDQYRPKDIQETTCYPTNITWVKVFKAMQKLAIKYNIDMSEHFTDDLHENPPRKYPEFRHNFSSLFTGIDLIDEWTDIDYATSFSLTFDNLVQYHNGGNKYALELANDMIRLVDNKTIDFESLSYTREAVEIAKQKIDLLL